jgi:hypothetical protein
LLEARSVHTWRSAYHHHLLAQAIGVRSVEHVMGMPIVVDVRDDSVDEATHKQLFKWLRFVDSIFGEATTVLAYETVLTTSGFPR